MPLKLTLKKIFAVHFKPYIFRLNLVDTFAYALMKVQSAQKAHVNSNTTPRRLSLGILPGSIGIGSGVVMDYPPTSAAASISTTTSEKGLKCYILINITRIGSLRANLRNFWEL